MSSFRKPSFKCCFDLTEHPEASQIISRVQSYYLENWSWENAQEKEHYLKYEIERAAMYTVPFTLPERAEAITAWYTWGFLVDDKMEAIPGSGHSKAAQFLPFVNLILGKTLPDQSSPLQTVTYRIFQNFLDVEDEQSKELGRVIQVENVNWVKFMLLSASSERKEEMSFEAMIEQRKGAAGMPLLWPVIRWGLNIHLSQDLLARSDVRRIEDITELYCIFINDLYSYKKEVNAAQAQGATPESIENVIPVLMREKGLSEELAVQEITNHLRNFEGEVTTIEAEFLAEFHGMDRNAVELYIRALKSLMAGTNTPSDGPSAFVLSPSTNSLSYSANLNSSTQPFMLNAILIGSPQKPTYTRVARPHVRVVPHTPHAVTPEDIFEGYRIPAGSTIVANQWAMLHDERDYPNLERFDPDRFLKDGKLDPSVKNPMDIAFGFGRRLCPGRQMGHSTIMLTAASILSLFNLEKKTDEYGNVIEPTGEYVTSLISIPLYDQTKVAAR